MRPPSPHRVGTREPDRRKTDHTTNRSTLAPSSTSLRADVTLRRARSPDDVLPDKPRRGERRRAPLDPEWPPNQHLAIFSEPLNSAP